MTTPAFDPRKIVRERGEHAVRIASEIILEAMREYPEQKGVTRAQAYGQTFESLKQQRFFFGALASGQINVPYRRTMGLRNSWLLRNHGMSATISSPIAGLIMGDAQNPMSRLIGWKTVRERLDALRPRINEALRRGR